MKDRQSRWIRGSLALVAGWFVVSVLSLATEPAVGHPFPHVIPEPEEVAFPSAIWMVVILIYTAFYGLVAGFVTGLVARRGELGHTAVLALFLLVYGGVSTLLGQHKVPYWWHGSLLLLIFLAVIAGGALCRWQRKRHRHAHVLGS